MNREHLGNVFRHIRQMLHAGAADTPAADLLQRFAVQHDEADFAALVERFGPLVWNVCARVLDNEHDAADAFQSTFLILATKAGSVRRRQAVGSWLYGVAYHVARKIQRRDARRSTHERQARVMTIADPVTEVCWSEVRSILDDVLQRLPEKYRTALVLCYLEGKTNEQVARELGWPPGSMSRHLAKGRELLREQLRRRGVALSVPVLATLLAENSSAAAVPVTLKGATVQASLLFVVGKMAAVSPAVVLATQAALRDMTLKPLSILAVLLLAVGTAGTVLFAGLQWASTRDTLSASPMTDADSYVSEPNEPAKEAAVPRALVADWPLYGGNASRTGQGVGGEFKLEPAWRRSTLLAPENGSGDARVWAEDMINSGRRQLEQKGWPVIPAFQPLVTQNLIIYRTYNGVYAACSKDFEFERTVDGEKTVEKKKPGDLSWWSHTDGGILCLVRDPDKKGVIDSWRGQYNQWGSANAIFENSLTGTLSTDGVRVYAVDDLILPPHPLGTRMVKEKQIGELNYAGLAEQVKQRNTLKAFHIEIGGALRWELGGDHDPANDTKDSFFLGAPLPINGKLFVLNEKAGALRLICLRPRDDGSGKNPPAPEILWIEELTKVQDRIALDFPRRLHAAHVSYSDGILVCPSNAGEIFGVDLLARRVAWKYRYENPPPKLMPKPAIGFNLNAQQVDYLIDRWKVTAPAILDGKLIFAAPDGAALECLEVRTGKPRWKAPRAAGDLYFAGAFDGLALVVNRDHCRALKLADGKEVWKLDKTGMPSGQGVAASGIYYLPLTAGAESKEPEVLAIDIA